MSKAMATSYQTLAAHLPPEWHESPRDGRNQEGPLPGHKVVVLDDDPTGTQTVHGLQVLTTWDYPLLQEALLDADPAFYILTNSRSMRPGEANALGRELGARLGRASRETGITLTVISRSDSTLRGHFPSEVEALMEGLAVEGVPPADALIFAPAFFEGGRVTLGDVHWVRAGGTYVPVSETEYARDPAFGFRHSHLPSWIEEKTGGRVSREDVLSLDLETIRCHGPDGVMQRLRMLPRGGIAVVNAIAYADLRVVAAAIWRLAGEGWMPVIRSAASFVRVLAGLPAGRQIGPESLSWADQARYGGLVVVGSHIELSSRQLDHLLRQKGIHPVEISVCRLAGDDRTRTSELNRVREQVEQGLRRGGITVAFTSREVMMGTGSEEYLNVGQRVSDGVATVVQSLRLRPRFLIAKGGITSSEVATRGLGCRRARVLGQIIPGVPVWRLGRDAGTPDLPYVVFPGNVGDVPDLSRVAMSLWQWSEQALAGKAGSGDAQYSSG